MKVLHIISGDLNGGAARGAYWLHLGLKEFGIDSKIFTNSRIIIGDDSVVTSVVSKKDKLFNVVRGQLDNFCTVFYPKKKRVIFSTGFFGVNFIKTKEYKEADIIHLHWINGGFLNVKHLSKINKPIVWTVRDMWPMTGGCHYSMGCEKYKNGCGYCTQLNSNFKYDLSWFVLKRKKKYFPKNIKIVGISPWISEEAKKSYIFNDYDIRYIFNNVNTNDFYPIKKDFAREVLGIKTDKKIILAGAQSLKDFYKGFDKYIEALKTLDKDKYFLCFFGNLDKNIVDELGFEYKSLGFLYDTISLKLVYNASDVFVAPSIMDAFGKTVAEAMSCKIPVVCFDSTGPKYIVDHKINGYKAKPFDCEDLAHGIEWVLNSLNYDELCYNAREKVLNNFDSKIVAKQYINLYKEILKT